MAIRQWQRVELSQNTKQDSDIRFINIDLLAREIRQLRRAALWLRREEALNDSDSLVPYSISLRT
jgi:hypothetical protein